MTNENHLSVEQRLTAPPIRYLAAILALGAGAVFMTLLNRSGEAPPEQYAIFARLFFFNDHVGSLAMLIGAVLALKLRPIQSGTVRLAAWVGRHPGRTCAIAFVALAAGARFVYLSHPLSMDEYAPVMQASAFARGDLTAHYPVALLEQIVAGAFRGNFILVDPSTGSAMSAYWPGLALLLTPFVFVHAAWMLNAALTALALALIGDLAARSGGDPADASLRRGWAMLAALASPAFTVNAMSFYAMSGLLALNLLYLWLLLKPGHRHAFAAGLVGGLALVLHNPVPHALMAVPCLVWMMADRARRVCVPALIAGYLPLALLGGLGWPLLSSSLHMARAISTTGHEGFVADWVHRVGRIFSRPSEDTLDARWYATWKIWIWACPGLMLAPFVVRPRDAALKLMLAAFVLTFLFYFLVPFDQGHGWGYRYIHPAWAVLPIAGGLWFARPGATRTLGAVVVAAGLLATPAFLWETHATIAGFLAMKIEPPEDGRWVVFINTTPRYAGDLVQNPPGQERVLNLISRGDEKDRRLMAEQFPQAVLAVHDARGSSWRLSEPARSARGSTGTN